MEDEIWNQRQDDMIEFLGNERDFEIVIDDENIVPDFEALMPSVCEEIEEFNLEDLTSRMIEKHECELALLEEFENNLEDFPK